MKLSLVAAASLLVVSATATSPKLRSRQYVSKHCFLSHLLNSQMSTPRVIDAFDSDYHLAKVEMLCLGLPGD